MQVRIEQSWQKLLAEEFDKDYFVQLTNFVRHAYSTTTVYPPAGKIFAAFDFCPVESIKVVIVGQDPYHGPNQANGLSFSVSDGIKQPPSLVNIFKEIASDCGVSPIPSGNLERWAKQGVFLLNASLTVEGGKANSHQKIGWATFTDNVIKKISDECTNVVFMLWGNFARNKRVLVDSSKHLVLEAAHPSPLAGGAFFGCRHFSKANEYLITHNKTPIDWR